MYLDVAKQVIMRDKRLNKTTFLKLVNLQIRVVNVQNELFPTDIQNKTLNTFTEYP